MKVDEIANLSDHDSIVSVAERSCGDQAEGDREPRIDRRATCEKPPADGDHGGERERGEYQTAVRQGSTQSPKRSGIVAGLELENVRHQNMRRRLRLADPRKDGGLGRKIKSRPAQGDRPRKGYNDSTGRVWTASWLPSSELSAADRRRRARHCPFSSFLAQSMQWSA